MEYLLALDIQRSVALQMIQSKGKEDELPTKQRDVNELINEPVTSTEFELYLNLLARFVVQYYDDPTIYDVTPDVKHGFLYNKLPKNCPQNPDAFNAIFDDFKNQVVPGGAFEKFTSLQFTHWQHPFFFAYYPIGRCYPDVLADFITSAISVIGFSWDSCPALSEVEHAIVNWVGRAFGIPETFLFQDCPESSQGGGTLTESGSDAIFCALLAARQWKINQVAEQQQRTGVEKYATIHDIAKRLVVYCSKDGRSVVVNRCERTSSVAQFFKFSFMAHFSTEKGCKLAMLRCRAIQPLEENQWGLTGEQIQMQIEKVDIEKGLIPCFISCTLGTTATASCDKLTSIIPVAKKYDTWLHVDADYAGGTFVVQKNREVALSILMSSNLLMAASMTVTIVTIDREQNDDELVTVRAFTHEFSVRFIKLSPEDGACATYEELAQQHAPLAGQTMIIILLDRLQEKEKSGVPIPGYLVLIISLIAVLALTLMIRACSTYHAEKPTKGVFEKSPTSRKSKQSEPTRSDGSKSTSIAEITLAKSSVKEAGPSDNKDKLRPELSKDTSNAVSKEEWDDFAIVTANRRGSEEVNIAHYFLRFKFRSLPMSIRALVCMTIMEMTHRQHPRFYGYFLAGRPYPDILAEVITSAIAFYIFSWKSCPSLHELEYTVVNWVGRAFGLPEEFLFQEDPQNSAGGGSIYGSASNAIFCSVMVSRYWKIKQVREKEKAEKTPKYETVHDIAKNLVVYCSKDAHSAIEKACKVTMVRCRSIDPLQENKWGITGPQLEKHIVKDLESGLIPTHFHCTLGTAATAADDDLASIFPVAEKYGLWIHCDASYSGNAWIDEKYRGNA
ncbi:unnamed protein product [Angiostrongylus costaricensis]|uniref:Aromatic-L-amino-acid decarboxylase n=1 Tax=Angiostrongylus costaricensis TaxID=334426 RepID=A0A158PFY0_ANGCS|nr:unnamed protein product [Angiostrongylus costaricensis]